jgi:chemotaxis protein MotB
LRDGLRVNLSEEILFATGSAELGEKGRDVLLKVSAELEKVPYEIEVGGHTDNVPIRGRLASLYPTNWELAGARATRVVRLLEEAGIANNRLLGVSYGETNPVASNDTPEGRAQNRRIEILMRPIERTESTPGTPSSSGR